MARGPFTKDDLLDCIRELVECIVHAEGVSAEAPSRSDVIERVARARRFLHPAPPGRPGPATNCHRKAANP